MNNWAYCDPDKFIDQLPQPFRMIQEVLEEEIMKKTNAKIDEVESLRSNPSYEGHLKKASPSGGYEIDNITCFSQQDNALGYVLAGDAFGSVYLLDIVNKAKLSRLETKERKPVCDIHMRTVKYGEKTAIIFFVACLGRFEVDCYMMISSELLHIRKVFSFGREPKILEDPNSKKDKKAVPVVAAPKKDKKKEDEQVTDENVPKVEYFDNYPFVSNRDIRK